MTADIDTPERTLHIRNMVCNRCILVVRTELERLGLHPLSVELGIVHLADPPSPDTLHAVRGALEPLGFELIDDPRARWVERIRGAVIEWVRGDADRRLNFSEWLASRLGRDYDALSRLFSESTGTTVERHLIAQKIERVKELLVYGELSLAQIADDLGYSSAAYLSTQFKNVTGLTPTAFRALRENRRKPLDEV